MVEGSKALADAQMQGEKRRRRKYIHIVQMNGGPKYYLCFVNLDGKSLRKIGGKLDCRPFGRISFVHLDCLKNSIWTFEHSSSLLQGYMCYGQTFCDRQTHLHLF